MASAVTWRFFVRLMSTPTHTYWSTSPTGIVYGAAALSAVSGVQLSGLTPSSGFSLVQVSVEALVPPANQTSSVASSSFVRSGFGGGGIGRAPSWIRAFTSSWTFWPELPPGPGFCRSS